MKTMTNALKVRDHPTWFPPATHMEEFLGPGTVALLPVQLGRWGLLCGIQHNDVTVSSLAFLAESVFFIPVDSDTLAMI